MINVITNTIRDMLALRRLRMVLDADHVRTDITDGGNVLVTVTSGNTERRFVVTVVEARHEDL